MKKDSGIADTSVSRIFATANRILKAGRDSAPRGVPDFKTAGLGGSGVEPGPLHNMDRQTRKREKSDAMGGAGRRVPDTMVDDHLCDGATGLD